MPATQTSPRATTRGGTPMRQTDRRRMVSYRDRAADADSAGRTASRALQRRCYFCLPLGPCGHAVGGVVDRRKPRSERRLEARRFGTSGARSSHVRPCALCFTGVTIGFAVASADAGAVLRARIGTRRADSCRIPHAAHHLVRVIAKHLVRIGAAKARDTAASGAARTARTARASRAARAARASSAGRAIRWFGVAAGRGTTTEGSDDSPREGEAKGTSQVQ